MQSSLDPEESVVNGLQKMVEHLKMMSASNPGAYLSRYADALMELAALVSDNGKYETAVQLGSQAVEIYEKLLKAKSGDVGCKIFRAKINLGRAYRFVGDLETAIDLLSEVRSQIAISEHSIYEQQQVQAYALWSLAGVWMNKGVPAKAEEFFKLSAGIFKELIRNSPHRFAPAHGGVNSDLSECLLVLNRTDEALDRINVAMLFLAGSGRYDLLAPCQYIQSRCYKEMGDYENALISVDNSINSFITLFESKEVSYNEMFLWAVQYRIELLLERDGFTSPKLIYKRVKYLFVATNWIAHFRSKLPKPFDREDVETFGKKFHFDLAYHIMRLGLFFKMPSALTRCVVYACQNLELGSHRRLYFLMNANHHRSIERRPMLEDGEIISNSPYTHDSKSDSRILRPKAVKDKTSIEPDDLSNRPRDVMSYNVEQSLSDAADLNQSLDNELPAWMSGGTSWAGMAEDEVLIYIEAVRGELIMMITWKSESIYFILSHEIVEEMEKELASWAIKTNLYFSNSSRSGNEDLPLDDSSFPSISRNILSLILENVPTEFKRILFCSGQFLSWFPIESIKCNGIALNDIFDICRIPNFTTYLKKSLPILGRESLIIINPTEDLKLSWVEGSIISTFITGTTLAGAEATHQAIIGKASTCNIFHYCGHAIYDKSRPYESSLCTSDEVGISIMHCFKKLNLEKCNVAFLNGCETAQGFGLSIGSNLSNFQKFELGSLIDDSIHISLAIFAAGARCVIGTLWKTPDLSSALVAWKFYQEYLQETKHPDAANSLRKATTWLRSISSGNELITSVMPLFIESISHVPSSELEQCKDAFYEEARKSESSPPFAHPRYWAAYVIWGNPVS